MSRIRPIAAVALALAIAASPLYAMHQSVEHRSLDAISLLDAMNRERVAHGLHPLRLNERLTLAATDRMRDMFEKHYFDHTSPDGIDPFSWLDKRGYDYAEAGENLSVGYATAADIVDGWMKSPAHRVNVLNEHFDEVGVAVTAASPTHKRMGPTVVALYGTRRS
jgi:uncharacterized protein YkwD